MLCPRPAKHLDYYQWIKGCQYQPAVWTWFSGPLINICQVNGQFSKALWAGHLLQMMGSVFNSDKSSDNVEIRTIPTDTQVVFTGSQATYHLTGCRSGLRAVGRSYSRKIHTVPHFPRTSNTYFFIRLGTLDIQNKFTHLKINL